MSRKRNRDQDVAAATSSSNTKCSRLDVEQHPLENVEILSRIFSFCSVKDLKNCRLVGSRLWLNESLSSWREKAVLMVLPEEDERYNPGIILKDLKKIYNDKKSPLQFRQKPFKNYKLKGLRCEYGRHSQMKWVFDKLSIHMRYLAFKNYQFRNFQSFLDTIFIKLPHLVELKLESAVVFDNGDGWRLRALGFPEDRLAQAGLGLPDKDISSCPDHQNLKCITVQMDEYLPALPSWFPWEVVLKKLTDLQVLRIKSPGVNWKTAEGEGGRIMRAVAKVRREDNSKLGIKNLEILSYPFTGSDDFGSPLPLERFTGVIGDVEHWNWKAFSETLKFLSLFVTEKKHTNSASDEERIADMDKGNEKLLLPNLTELHADGQPSQVFKNLNKVEALNMKTLLVDDDPSENSRSCGCNRSFGRVNISIANPSFVNVTRLECYNAIKSWYTVDAEDLKRLSESMPNVLHAKVPLTGLAFKELCKAWPNILTLTISDSLPRFDFSPVDDEAIAGTGADSGSEESRPPNITNLKHLTEFVVRFPALTDVSVNFGFLHCPQLHYLKVDFLKISKEAESALRKKVNVVEM